MNITDIANQVASTAIYQQNALNFLRQLGVPEDAILRMDMNEYLLKFSALYNAMGALGEAAEALQPFKKWMRGDAAFEDTQKKYVAENRDTFWYVMEGFRTVGLGAEVEIRMLLDKLQSRQETGTINGSGESYAERQEKALLEFLQFIDRTGLVQAVDVLMDHDTLKQLSERGFIILSLNGSVQIGRIGKIAIQQGIKAGIIQP